MKKLSVILTAWICLAGVTARAQGGAVEATAHNELRTLRTNVIEAITRGDFDAVLGYVHTNVVVTWQNNEVCRGHQGLREFFNRMGKNTFKGYKVPPTPDELTIFHGGNTGISFGRTVAQYTVFGKEHELQSRWTATLVRENGRWLLASYHLSMNVLNNPLLNAATKSLYWMGGLTLVIGLIVGLLIGRRRRPASAGPGV